MHRKPNWFLAGITLAAFTFTNSAQSGPLASASASAFVDIDTLNVVTTGTATFSLNGNDAYEGVVAVPGSSQQTFTANDLFVSAGSYASAESNLADPTFIEARADADSSGWGDAFASAVLEYAVGGIGQVTLEFEYELAVDLLDTGDPGAFVIAEAILDLGFDSDIATLDFDGSAANVSDTLGDILTLTFDVNSSAIDELLLSAETLVGTNQAIPSVPVPATLPLMLTGLGLVGYRMRRRTVG